MYKLIKLTKLLRVLKMVKERANLMDFVQDSLKIGIGFQRLSFFMLYFFIFCHIISCLWVMAAQFEEGYKGTWMEGPIQDMTPGQQYLTSLYYTITTITTVGYGDISGNTPLEKIFCIFIMIIGVVAFSFASGSLASILQNYDSSNAKYEEKLQMLNNVYKKYNLPNDLYSRLKQSFRFNQSKEAEDLN